MDQEQEQKNDPSPSDLAWVTDQELLDELGRRSEALVMIRAKQAKGDAEIMTPIISWRGGLFTAKGLLDFALKVVEFEMTKAICLPGAVTSLDELPDSESPDNGDQNP